MVDVAFIAVSLALSGAHAPIVAGPLATRAAAPPTRDGYVEFDPAGFLRIPMGGSLPVELLTRETVGLELVSRTGHEGGAFYVFQDPLFSAAHASLFVRDGRLTGAIYNATTLRTVIRAEKSGLSNFTIEDAARDLPCGCTGHDMPGQPAIGADGGIAGAACDTGSTVDVLVVYTDAAVAQAGSEVGLLDQIAWGIADSTAIYTGSGVGLSARLVGTSRLNGYVESGDMGVDLDRLTAPADGFIDGVHATRNAVGADLVALVRADGGGYCGVAWLLPSNSSAESASAFSVTALGCFSNKTFTHEMGHNMGCCHAPGDGGGCLTGGVFPYSVGHRFFGGDGIQYRTVMAYSPGTRIPRFSSPSISWAGTATGTAVRDNARTINETRAAFANFRCSADGTGSCGSGGPCYATHAAPGCNDIACCSAVCAVDNYCCLNQWDSICVSEALDLCTSCGSAETGSCFTVHSAPSCNDSACCAIVCGLDPFCCNTTWDQICTDEALEFCAGCGDAGSGSCYVVHAGRFCDNDACCQLVCTADPFCCNVTWDTWCASAAISGCPNCGNPSAGSCYEVHTTPYCADAVCCGIVCAADPFCCNTTWDNFCSEAAVANCPGCGNPSGGSCFAPHASAYCSDATCCATVCDSDPFCCNAVWDSLCVDEAFLYCSNCGAGKAGSCYIAHTTPFCDDPSCCEVMCAIDPTCCDLEWDAICAGGAAKNCPGCGNPLSGSCYVAHASTFCDKASCCDAVCAADPFCCNTTWDNVCADEAGALCPACGNPTAGSCYTAHAAPFCDQASCCDAVCVFDPFCCNTVWDGICANEAIETCPGCGNPTAGDCTVAHVNAYCSDAACCAQVCALDTYCCTTEWDNVCANEAIQNCVQSCGGSLAGDCCFIHSAPACNEASCCEAVCANDSFCCTTSWDSYCANAARIHCGQCCATDLNFDGTTNAADLSALLANWAMSGGDISGDGTTNAADLSLLLAGWGDCP